MSKIPLYGTYKTAKAKFWPCLSGQSPQTLSNFSLFAQKWKAEECVQQRWVHTQKTARERTPNVNTLCVNERVLGLCFGISCFGFCVLGSGYSVWGSGVHHARVNTRVCLLGPSPGRARPGVKRAPRTETSSTVFGGRGVRARILRKESCQLTITDWDHARHGLRHVNWQKSTRRQKSRSGHKSTIG